MDWLLYWPKLPLVGACGGFTSFSGERTLTYCGRDEDGDPKTLPIANPTGFDEWDPTRRFEDEPREVVAPQRPVVLPVERLSAGAAAQGVAAAPLLLAALSCAAALLRLVAF